MDKWTERYFSNEVQMASKYMKMSTIFTQQTNGNQNFTEMQTHFCWNASHQENTQQQMLARIDGGRWSLYSVGENVNYSSRYGNQNGGSFKN
jgi:hypothetical protein